MIITIKQTDYSKDFAIPLSTANITGIKNARPTDKRNYWTWVIDLDELDWQALKQLPVSSPSEKNKFIKEITVVKCNDFNDFINNLSQEITLGTKYYVVIGDIVNEYYNQKYNYYMYDFLDNHDLSKAKKLLIDQTVLTNSSTVSSLEELNNHRIKAIVTVSIDAKHANITLRTKSIEVLGLCTREEEYNQLFQKYKPSFDSVEEFCLSTPRPRIALICGKNHGEADFRNTLHHSLQQQLEAYYVNMNNINDIAEQIKDIDAENLADVICIVRGGGDAEDLCKYNDIRLLDAIINSQTPIITGIGHKNDRLLARQLSSHGAVTPTAAAEFLNKEYRKFFATHKAKEKESTVPKADYDDLRKECDRLRTKNTELAAQNTNLNTKNKALIAEIEKLKHRGIISRLLNF